MHKMSGLCAVLATRPEPAAVASVLARMAPWLARRRMNGKAIVADYGGRTRILESTAHAGADGTRFLLTGSNGLLSSVDQGCWLAFDGEIYNRAELCQQLGAPYLTHITNAGLVLAAYERWGVECVSRFNGAWAFLLLDLRHGKLIGSRDHLGIKPLYFGERNGHLVLRLRRLRRRRFARPRLCLHQFSGTQRGDDPDARARGCRPDPPRPRRGRFPWLQ